jgi:uncharacterized protein (TIGR04255 family)
MLCFPPYEDVRLQRSPLREVICQIRFPALLRIVEERPVAFQERVRQHFPELERQQEIRVETRPPAAEQSQLKLESPVFRFTSRDGQTLASLGINFYAVSTTAYTHWSEFLDLILFVHRAACDVYELPYAARVGLRYINHITYGNTGATSPPGLWDILRPEITAMLRSECWDIPEGMRSRLSLADEQDEKLTLQTAFVPDEGSTDQGPTMVLDLDYYAQGEIELDTVPDRCERYHEVLYRGFRWCIREDQLSVFQPVLDQE